MNKHSLYWLCQIGGWLMVIFINGIFLEWTSGLNSSIAFSFFLLFFFGVIYSHIYRSLIIRFNLLRLGTWKALPLVVLFSMSFALLLHFSQLGMESLLRKNTTAFSAIDLQGSIKYIVNIALLFFFWSLIYFLVHYVENYKKAEIENLKWQASINEIELNKLKSQLNPHFIFNSMNSIRALVDEDPLKAKDAITQLSGILRNTLLMGKKKVIPFEEELHIVKDYLALESTRLEERLKVELQIDPLSAAYEVPPLMLQTLVENGIKHGISRLTAGGELSLKTMVNGSGKLHIHIRNSGRLGSSESGSGFGIKNTIQRLNLLYGPEASFDISNENDNTVHTHLVIPKNLRNESYHN